MTGLGCTRSMGNPWIFEEIKAAMNGASYVPPPLEKKLATAMHQIKNMVKDKGERVGLLEARRHLSYYIKGGTALRKHGLNSTEPLLLMNLKR